MTNFHMDSTSGFAVSPANITVIGGGRWARILTEVIRSIVDTNVQISIYSPSNAAAMSEWVSSHDSGHNIKVFTMLPQRFSSTPNAVIIVNAVRDHEKAVVNALSAGGTVLVEKPITLTYQASQKLVTLAGQLGQPLATAHIFLFARYFENFSRLVSRAGKVTAINVQWVDPGSESRYGELKQYDAGLPVFADWLPHVLSMAGALAPGTTQSCLNTHLTRAGASIELDIRIGDIPCQVSLTRNGNKRKRFMEVVAGGKTLALDFSAEPGIITDGSVKISGDVDWQIKEHPATAMIRAFLKGAAGKGYDERLDPEIGLKASLVISQVTPMYHAAQVSWLAERLALGASIDEDIHYALSEILQLDQALHIAEVNRKIKRLIEVINGDSGKYWLNLLKENKKPSTIMQMASK